MASLGTPSSESSDAQEWRIRPTYQSGIEDYTKTKLSISGQPFRIPRRVAKTSSIEFTLMLVEAYW